MFIKVELKNNKIHNLTKLQNKKINGKMENQNLIL